MTKSTCGNLIISFLLSIIFILTSNNSAQATSHPFIVPTNGTLTSDYGLRSDGFHHGVDIARGGEVPILASYDGTVSKSYTSSSYGEVVFIKHDVGGTLYETVYAHMRNRAVQVGDVVKQGQFIGFMGNTGNSTGQHLHFEVHQPDWNIDKTNSVDPFPLFKETQYKATATVNVYDVIAPDSLKSTYHTTGQVLLKWNYDDVADYFNIYRSVNGVFSIIGTTVNKDYIDPYLDNGQTYYYYVTAVINGVESPGSNNVRQTPPLTTIEVNEPLRIVDIMDNKVVLEFKYNYGPYKLYMDGTEVYSSNATSLTYEITDPIPSQVYQFQIITNEGFKTNYVDVIFDDSSDRLIAKLDQMLTNLFVPDDTKDTDLDGTPDWQEPLNTLYDQMKTKTVVGQVIQIGESMTTYNNYYDSTSKTNTTTSMIDTNGDGVEESIVLAYDSDGTTPLLEVPSLLDGFNQMPLWLKDIFETAKTLLKWIMWACLFIYLFSRFMPRPTL
jgi:hypothetical protein